MSPACYALFDRTLRDGKRRGYNFFQRLLGDYVSGERTLKTKRHKGNNSSSVNRTIYNIC